MSDADLERAAQAFVAGPLEQALRAASDGGIALSEKAIRHLFFEVASWDMEKAAILLDIAEQAIQDGEQAEKVMEETALKREAQAFVNGPLDQALKAATDGGITLSEQVIYRLTFEAACRDRHLLDVAQDAMEAGRKAGNIP